MTDLTLLTSSSPIPHRNPKNSLNPKNPKIPKKPLLSDVRRNLITTTTNRRLLKYYARLASDLAGAGKLPEFLMLAETVLTADSVAGDASQFVARIDTRAVAAGVAKAVREGGIGEILEFFEGAKRMGMEVGTMVSGEVMGEMGREGRRLVEERRMGEFVGLMETLAGYGISVKDILDPVDVLKFFVEKRDPNMSIRYDHQN